MLPMALMAALATLCATGAAAQPSVTLTAAPNGQTRIELAWTVENASPTGYLIRVSDTGDSNSWSDLATDTDSMATAYTHAGLTAGTTKYYWVRVFTAGGELRSGGASATTSALMAPTGLMAEAKGKTRIELAWTAPAVLAADAPTGYKIEWSPNGTNQWTSLAADTGSTSTAYNDAGLIGGTTRHYRVSAIGPGGTSGPSASAFATTEAPDLPAAPTGLTAVGRTISGIGFHNAVIDLSWTAPAAVVGGPITGYKIEAGFVASVFANDPLESNTGSMATTYRHALGVDKERQYRVSAINAAGTGPPSNVSIASTKPPPAPSGLTAVANGRTRIDLEWQGPSSGRERDLFDITGFKIETSPNGNDQWTTLEAALTATAPVPGETWRHTYSHIGLAGSTTRHYRVSSVNGIGTGSPSATASATTDAPDPPGAPTGLTAVAKLIGVAGSRATVIDLSWTAPAADGGSPITGYRVENARRGASAWPASPLATTTGTTYRQPIGAMQRSVERQYRVSAINAAGVGAASELAFVVSLPPPAPILLTVDAHGLIRFDLQWQGPASNLDRDLYDITGFKIEVSPDGTDGSWTTAVANHVAPPPTQNALWRHSYRYTVPHAEYSRSAWRKSPTRHFRVAAINGVGTSPTVAAFGTADAPPLVHLAAEPAGQRQIDLSWTFEGGVPEDAQHGFVVLSSATGTTDSFTTLASNENSAATTFSDTTLGAAGTTRHYRVHALFHGGSPRSTPASATTFTGIPTGLTATATGQSRIDLNWEKPAANDAEAPTGYKVETSSDGESGWSTVAANTGSAATTYTHTDLTAETTYYYRVSGIGSGGTSDPSDTANATTAASGKPTGLTATAPGQTRIDLAWTAPTAETPRGYRIEVSDDGSDGSWTDLAADTGSSATTYSHSDLEPGTTKHYRVSAIGSGGTSDPSNTATATTPEAGTPTPPIGLKTTFVGQTLVRLEWQPPLVAEADAPARYAFTISESADPSYQEDVDRISSEHTSHEVTDLAPGTTYWFRAFAIAADNDESGPSNAVRATTLGEDDIVIEDLRATANGHTQIDLRWTPPFLVQGGRVVLVDIDASPTGAAGTWTTRLTGPASSYSHVRLSPGTTRHYRIARLRTSAGRLIGDLVSNTAHATTLPLQVPAPPTDLTAVAHGGTDIRVEWKPPRYIGGVDKLLRYRIERSLSPNSGWTTVGTHSADNPSTAAIDSGLEDETTYHYRVFAINSVGESKPSDVASVQAGSTPPVQALSAVASGSGTVDLSWMAPNTVPVAEIKEYFVQYESASMVDQVEYNTGSTTTTFKATGLRPSTRFTFYVSTVYHDRRPGPAARTTAATSAATAKPSKPTGLAADYVGNTEVWLSWQYPADGEGVTGYDIGYGSEGAPSWSMVSVDRANPHYEFAGLTPGDDYVFRVAARNAHGTSDWSDTVSATTETFDQIAFYYGVDDRQYGEGQSFALILPEAYRPGGTPPHGPYAYTLFQEDGSALPDWLRFDPHTRLLEPETHLVNLLKTKIRQEVSLTYTARERANRDVEISSTFKLSPCSNRDGTCPKVDTSTGQRTMNTGPEFPEGPDPQVVHDPPAYLMAKTVGAASQRLSKPPPAANGAGTGGYVRTLPPPTANGAPKFTPSANERFATENAAFSFVAPEAVDREGDSITYTAALEGGGRLPGCTTACASGPAPSSASRRRWSPTRTVASQRWGRCPNSRWMPPWMRCARWERRRSRWRRGVRVVAALRSDADAAHALAAQAGDRRKELAIDLPDGVEDYEPRLAAAQARADAAEAVLARAAQTQAQLDARAAQLGNRELLGIQRRARLQAQQRNSEAQTAREALEGWRAKRETAAARLDAARGECAAARTAEQQARTADRAATLRHGLEAGQPCPVCEQPVAQVPKGEADAAAALAAAQQRTDAAEAAMGECEQAFAPIDKAFRDAELEAAGARAAQAAADKAVEDAPALDAIEQSLAALAAHGRELAQLHEMRTGAQTEADAAARAQEQLESSQTGWWNAYQLRLDALARAGEEPPRRAAGESMAAAWKALGAWAGDRAAAIAAQAQEAQERGDALAAKADADEQILREACKAFDIDFGDEADAAFARAMAHAQTRIDKLRADVEERDRAMAQRADCRASEVAAATLGEHLTRKGFLRWLFAEAFAALAARASEQLRALTEDQYDFAYDARTLDIEVIDHANAEERRKAETLSGGETFIASLALALALSEEVGEMGTAASARVESIFLDEGFGTLDDVALDTVANILDSLEGLRTIGLVTHVEALAARVPVRFEVTKTADAAGVRRVDR